MSENEPELVMCTTCNGTGLLPQTVPGEPGMIPNLEAPLRCPVCDGRGWVKPISESDR